MKMIVFFKRKWYCSFCCLPACGLLQHCWLKKVFIKRERKSRTLKTTSWQKEMLTVNPIQSCWCQPRGNLRRSPCPEARAHIPHPSCCKRHCRTQQAQDYWKHSGHTAWESGFFPAQRWKNGFCTAVGVVEDSSTIQYWNAQNLSKS